THNPEFTMLECYAAYWNESDMMGFVEDLFIALATAFGEKQEITADSKKIIFKKPFPRIAFSELLSRYAQVTDYEREDRDSLAIRARQLGVETAAHESKGKIADEIYKKICRPHLVQPTFLINHPLDISPLAKKRDENKKEVRRLQLVVAGAELANGWAELNDPIDQRERFVEQEQERQGGEDDAMRMDEDYVEAMEYGMPPAAGLGIGIDRVVMLFTDTKNIREVVLFPTMRPKP
ncbi:MAG: amino acid--tRNA ligase-related protein, partial [Candidatus Sungiibacteriota bacterium]